MRDMQIQITAGASSVLIDLDYRAFHPGPDPWDLRLPRGTAVFSSGDWLCDAPTREVRFSTDVLDLTTGTTSHDVVLILVDVPHLPGVNPFCARRNWLGKTGPVTSIFSGIPPGTTVSWSCTVAPPDPIPIPRRKRVVLQP
jgi:hypothetical protein